MNISNQGTAKIYLIYGHFTISLSITRVRRVYLISGHFPEINISYQGILGTTYKYVPLKVFTI